MCLSPAQVARLRPALRDACAKDGCTLNIAACESPITIVDADEHQRLEEVEGQIADYYIFLTAANPLVAVVEMKGGRLDARDAIRQIAGGAVQVQAILGSLRVGFLPLVLCGRGGHAAEFKLLRRLKVPFQGLHHSVIWKRCGARLAEILQEFS